MSAVIIENGRAVAFIYHQNRLGVKGILKEFRLLKPVQFT